MKGKYFGMLFQVITRVSVYAVLILLSPLSVPGQASSERELSEYRRLAEEDPGNALKHEQKALELSVRNGDIPNIISSYTRIGSHYRQHSDYVEAIRYFNNAVNTGKEQHRRLLGPAYLELGIAYLRLAEPDSSREALMSCLAISEENGDKGLEASVFNMLGNVYKDKNDYQGAVGWYLKGLEIFESLRDSSGLTQVISNVGNMEYLLGNYDKAMTYAQSSLDIASNIGQESSVAYSNRLIGRIYRKQGKLQEALRSYDKAIKIYSSIGARRDVSETYYNSGNIHYELSNFTVAIQYYRDALTIQQSIQDTLNMAYSYSAIAQAYFELKNSLSALLYFDSAQFMAERKRLPYVMLDVHYFRSEIFAHAGAWQKAYTEHVAYATIEDTLTATQNRLAAQELESRYQDEKKEEQIRALHASNELTTLKLKARNAERYYLIGIATMILAIAGLIYSRYKTKVRTAEKLEELDRMKTRFFTNISHEFRTPLSLIIAPLQTFIERETDEKRKRELELVSRNANRLSSLIDQLLDLSRLDAGHVELKVSRFNSVDVMRLIAANFQSLAQAKDIAFTTDLNPGDEMVYADRDKFEKILLNLLSNAFKYTDNGGTIALSCERNGDLLTVRVKDDGMGVSKENLSRIFDRFFRSEAVVQRGDSGSGIGLALCKELVSLHKGTIDVESGEERGCTFRFTIPVSRTRYTQLELVEYPEAEVSGRNSSGSNSDVNGVTTEGLPILLVVEDNDEMRSFISRICQDEYRVVVAGDGARGLELTLERVPDIIITDVMMPQLDGMEFCQKVRQHPATSHIPVIMLTAKADIESRIHGLDTGADDYLAKPFQPRELLARLKNLIRQRRLLQEAFRKQIVIEPQQLKGDNPNDKFMADLLQLLNVHYSDPQFGVDQLAAGLNISRMQLNRKLKAVTGDTPGDLIRKYRLQHAESLLRTGGYQVSEVAFRTGFNNLSNFSKVFREYSGFLPSEYMEREKSARPVTEAPE